MSVNKNMSNQPRHSFSSIGDESSNALTSQDRSELPCTQQHVDGALLHYGGSVTASGADTAERGHWELLMKQDRAELYSATSDEFNSRAFKLRRLARSGLGEVGIRGKHNNLCDPPVLESAPGYPYYATSSFVPRSPIISSRIVAESAKAYLRCIPHFGSQPRPAQLLTPRVGIHALPSKRSHVDMESQAYENYSSRIFFREVSSTTSDLRPRFENLPPRVGRQVVSSTDTNSMKRLSTQCSPSQVVPEELLPMSTHTSDSNQLSSHWQSPYTASDYHTPCLSGIVGASQVTVTGPENKIATTSIFVDTSAEQAENSRAEGKVMKSKNESARLTDPIEVATPTEHDVLAGRGGESNKHCGNMVFREEARKLRVYYRMKDTSREDKFAISLVRCCSQMNNFDFDIALGFNPHRDCFLFA